jgi:chemotaxis protein MotA
MFPIIGIVVVFVAIVGGYLMEKGNLLVLLQPAELLIIAGAAVGTLLIANPPHVLQRILKSLGKVFGKSPYTRERYLESLKMLFDLFNHARKDGLSAVEADLEEPAKSKIFSAHPAIMSDPHVSDFICDSLRTATTGVVDPFDLDQMMETDMSIHHHGASTPIAALSTTADSLPGLGIVAAVLGVVITMGALGGPPEEIGKKVAAALVGTFLGILMCYGFLGPVASNLAKAADDEKAYYQVLRLSMMAFIKGTPPIMAAEAGRRAVPGHVRPSFKELETLCRNKPVEAAKAAA